MKKILFISLALVLLANYAFAGNPFNQVLTTKTDLEGRPLYHKDRIYIKIKDGVKINEFKKDSPQMNILKFGVISLDSLLTKFMTEKIEPSFKTREKHTDKVSAYIQKYNPEIPDISRIFTLKVPEVVNSQKLVIELNKNPNIEYAEFVPINYPFDVPNDTMYNSCQHLPQIMAEEAWAVFKGEQSDSTIVIGICDTGTDYNHEDLFGNLWQNLAEDANGNGTVMIWDDSLKKYVFDPGDINGIDDDGNGYIDDFIGWDFVENFDEGTQGNNPNDFNNHGTHVAGISAGVTNNELGIASISWNVKYLPTSHSAPGFDNIAYGFEGIVYLAQMGCDIVNCSWGGGGYSKTASLAIDYATSLGAIVVVAAGNSASIDDFYPSAYPNVISVSSVASTDRKSGYSNYGRCVDISAPGGENSVDGGILSCYRPGGYRKFQGTSMASPVVAGVFGLVKAYYPDWTNHQIITQVIGTADDVSALNPNYTNYLGSGRVNAFRALTETNVSIPKTLKLGLMTVNASDEESGNGNKAIEPGENIRLSFVIRNFALLSGSDNCTIFLSTDDNDVTIVKNWVNVKFVPDNYTETEYEIEIKISEKAVSKFIKFSIMVESEDAEILIGKTMDFELPVNAGGILIWEGINNGRGYSGNFIHSFLKGQGIEALYSNTFPVSLVGFDAVFLSFGCIGTNFKSTSFNDWMAEDVEDYLKSGGNLYVETMDGFGWDQAGNKELLQLFGIDSTNDGSDKGHIVDSLFGQDESIFKGLVYKGTSVTGFQSVDIMKAGGTGIPALVEKYTDAVIQNTGQFGQKTIASVYPVSALVDRNHPNQRYEFIKRVMDFFGLSMDYTIARYSYNPRTGHAPLEVSFTDISYTSKDVQKWEWNYDSTKFVEASGKTSKFIYENPGDFNPIMSVYNGITTQTATNPVYVFDGESSAFFNNTGRGSVTDTTMNITGKFTVEAWIYPQSTGQYEFGRIIDKEKIVFMMYLENSLRLYIEHENKEITEVLTSPNSVTFNMWQHVAVTFDGDSTSQIYINGNEVEIKYYPGRGDSAIADNKQFPLAIGNRQAQGRAFHGRIDELRIWNTVRSKERIRENLIKELSGIESGLIAYWQFDEGNGNKVEDKTGLGRNISFSADWRQGWHSSRITKHPQSVSECEGENITLSVELIEDGTNLSYQWFKDGNAISDDDKYSGFNQKILEIKDINSEDEGNYFVEITDKNTSKKEKTDEASVKSKILPLITTQPENFVGTYPGWSFEINISAKNENASYNQLNFEWFKDDSTTGITTPRLFVEHAGDENVGNYWCKVSNECGEIFSDTCKVELHVGVDEEFNEDLMIIVKPHPAVENSVIIINNISHSSLEIEIVNSLGIEIKSIKIHGYEPTKVINLNDYRDILSSGLYNINVKSEKGVISKSFIYVE